MFPEIKVLMKSDTNKFEIWRMVPVPNLSGGKLVLPTKEKNNNLNLSTLTFTSFTYSQS